MVYIVMTFVNDVETKSENIKIKNKLVYEVLNRYIREKENEKVKDKALNN